MKGLGFSEVKTLDWWQGTEAAGLKVTLTPCKHWGARMFTDTHRGYGGYVIEGGGHTVYHSGDTAYFPGFAEIGRRLGPVEVALMPIGAYFPDSYRAVHTSPEEGLQGFVDVGAERMVPMHFGTFRAGTGADGGAPGAADGGGEAAGAGGSGAGAGGGGDDDV